MSHKIATLTTLSAQFHGIKCIHNMIQPSSPSIFRAFSSSQTGTLYSLNNSSSYPPPESLMPTTLLSVFLNLASSGASYKWRHTIFVSLWQAYFTGHNVLKAYSCSSMSEFTSSLRLSSTLHVAMLCLSIQLFINTWVGGGPFPIILTV